MLWRLLCRLINTIKLAFPAQGSFRSTILKHSDVFILLRGRPQAAADEELEAQVEVVKLWHIGIQYLVPFRPTFRDCTIVQDNLTTDPMEVEAGRPLSWGEFGRSRGVPGGRQECLVALE